MAQFLRYTSEKVVVLHEKGMAIAYHLIIFVLLLFLIVYIGIIKDAHKSTFTTTATFYPTLLGKAYGYDPTNNKFSFFDQGDLFDPFQKGDSFFVPTGLYSTTATQDICGRQCSSEDDCPNVATFAEPVCSRGKCQEQSLCPVNERRYDYYQIAGVEHMTLKLMTVADFPGHSDYVYRRASPNKMVMYPKKNPTGITISDLLSLAKLNITQVSDTGATLRLGLILECDLDADKCHQHLKVQKIDVGTNVLLPLNDKQVNFYEEYIIPDKDNAEQALHRMLIGIRFAVNTQVIVKKFSLNKLFILLGVAFACVAFGSILMDWVMSHFLPEPRRKNFFRRKYLNSEDFSDLKDRLEEVRKLRKQQFEDLDEDEDHD